MVKAQKSAGRKKDGNVVVDMGEKFDQLLSKAGISGKVQSAYRPGSLGQSWRPSYAQAGSSSSLGERLGIPQSLNTGQAMGGALLGTVGNRLVGRLVPSVISTTSKLAVDAIAFGVGIIPFLAKRNSLTTGIALPGVIFLAGSLADYALDLAGVPKPALSGSDSPRISAAEQAMAARQRLASLHARLQSPQVAGQQPVRVVARPAFAA